MAATFDAANKPKVAAVENTKGLTGPIQHIDVTIDEIQVWSGQPRLVRNAAYDGLKESIRNIGLEKAIDLTIEPGVEGYVTRKGGGTRIDILESLWEETKDPKFYQHTFPLHPYPGDVAMRVSHNIENLERGEQTYGDTARSIAQLCVDLEKQTGNFKSLTLRAKADVITQWGLPIKANRLMLYLYTVERLLDNLPKAFNSGLGRPRVEAIRRVEKRYNDHVAQHVNDRSSDWEATFLQTLNIVDSESFDIEVFEKELGTVLQNKFNTSIPTRKQSPDLLDTGAVPGNTEHGNPTTSSTANQKKTPSPLATKNNNQSVNDENAYPSNPVPTGNNDSNTESSLDGKLACEAANFSHCTTPLQVREQASSVAIKLATDYGMKDALYTLTDPPVGLGYGVLSPDFGKLHERETWKDCLLVHSVVHSSMWASILIDVELGFLQRPVLNELNDSNPTTIGRAEAWSSPRPIEVVAHRQYLQSRVSAGTATSQQILLIKELSSMEQLAAQYARLMKAEQESRQEKTNDQDS